MLSNKRWITGGEMATARFSQKLETVNNSVVVLGGVDEDYSPTDLIEELELDDWTWSEMGIRMVAKGRVQFSALVIPKDFVVAP